MTSPTTHKPSKEGMLLGGLHRCMMRQVFKSPRQATIRGDIKILTPFDCHHALHFHLGRLRIAVPRSWSMAR